MVRIITDSASDLEPHEIKRMGIDCIPLSIFFGEDVYQELRDITKEQFYDLLLNSKEFPRTAQPARYAFESKFKEARDAGDEVIMITLSSALSGMYESALLAKKEVNYDKCYIFDSLNATGGQRIIVEYAVKLRDEGLDASQILEKLKDIRSRITLYACIETLEYMWRGGRLSKTAYTLGTISNIKPVIMVTRKGTIDVPAKILGMRRGINFIEKKLTEITPDPNFPLYVMYICDRKNADILADSLRKKGYDIPPEHIINVGPTIGSHVGPGGCGFVYVAKDI